MKIKLGLGEDQSVRNSLPCGRWQLDLVPVSSLGLRCQIQPELIHPLFVTCLAFYSFRSLDKFLSLSPSPYR